MNAVLLGAKVPTALCIQPVPSHQYRLLGTALSSLLLCIAQLTYHDKSTEDQKLSETAELSTSP